MQLCFHPPKSILLFKSHELKHHLCNNVMCAAVLASGSYGVTEVSLSFLKWNSNLFRASSNMKSLKAKAQSLARLVVVLRPRAFSVFTGHNKCEFFQFGTTFSKSHK